MDRQVSRQVRPPTVYGQSIVSPQPEFTGTAPEEKSARPICTATE